MAKAKVVEKLKEGKVVDKASEVAKNIWLAGLGAYGKAFDEAVAQYDKMSKDSTKLFDDLVAKGKKLDTQSHSKISKAKSKTTATIEERIGKVRGSLMAVGGDGTKIQELTKKVDDLTDKVDALLDAMSVETKAKRSKSSAA